MSNDSEATKSTAKADQADVIASLEKANADLATANASLETFKNQNATLKSQVESLTTGTQNLTDTLATRTQERDLAVKERDELKGKDRDLEKAVAARCAQLGISTTPPAHGAAVAGQNKEVKLDFTQQCLTAKGLPLDTKVET